MGEQRNSAGFYFLVSVVSRGPGSTLGWGGGGGGLVRAERGDAGRQTDKESDSTEID